jgi:hypothetical protein
MVLTAATFANWLDRPGRNPCQVFLSVVQRKVVSPNDFTDLTEATTSARRTRGQGR